MPTPDANAHASPRFAAERVTAMPFSQYRRSGSNCSSVVAQAEVFDELAHALCIERHCSGELLRRAWHSFGAATEEVFFHFRTVQEPHHLFVETSDDRGGCSRWCKDGSNA